MIKARQFNVKVILSITMSVRKTGALRRLCIAPGGDLLKKKMQNSNLRVTTKYSDITNIVDIKLGPA